MKLVICRPMGGLNDVLCQIGRCLDYAQRSGRKLVVDTRHPGTDSIRDDLSRYFTSKIDTMVLAREPVERLPADIECYPEAVRGRLLTYGFEYDDATGFAVEMDSQSFLTFPFEAELPHQVVLHHAWGGGIASLQALKFMGISTLIADETRRRLALIGGPYSGIHIRATDLQTHFEDGLKAIASRLPEKIFIGTDSQTTCDQVREALPHHRIYSFSELSGSNEKPLHYLNSNDNHISRNIDAIVDLLLLSIAREFFAFKIIASRPGIPLYSGYAQLVANLRYSPNILNGLLRSDPRLRRRVVWQRFRQWPKPRGLSALQDSMIAA